MALDDIRMRIILGVGGFESVSKATSAIAGMGPAAQKAAAGVNKAGSAAQKSQGLFAKLAEKLKETETQYDRVYRAGFQLQLVGDQLNATGQKGLDILGGTVLAYKDYDLMLRRAGVALNTNEEWQTKLDAAIKKTAVSVGLVKPEEAAAAYYMWGAATGVVVDSQQKLNEITSTVNDVLIATAAAGGDLERNLKGVYGVMQVYNRGADEGQYITHVLALMTERTAADFGDLINAFSYIGPLADSIGVSFEDTAQLLGFLADAGQRGSRAGRGLSMILEGLSAPSIKAEAALDGVIQKAYGVNSSFHEIVFPKGEFIGMRGFIDAMAKSMTGLTDSERGYVYATAFTNNATRALIPVVEKQIKLWDEQSAAGKELTSVLDEQKYALDGAGAFFEKMQSQMQGSIEAVIGSFQNSFFPIIQQVATQVMQVLSPALDFLKERFDQLGRFLEEHPGLTQAIVMFGAVISIILVVAGTVLSLVGSFLVLGAGIKTVAAIIPMLASAAAPVLITIAAIAAVAVVVYKAWTENWGGIQEKVAAVVDFFKANVLPVMKTVGKAVVDFAVKAADFITNVALPAISKFFADLGKFIGEARSWFESNLLPVFQRVASTISQMVTTATPYIMQFATFIGQVVTNIATFVTGTLIPIFQSIAGVVMTVAGVVIGAFQTIWDFIGPTLIWFSETVVATFMETVLPAIVSFVQNGLQFLYDMFLLAQPTVEAVINFFMALVEFITVTMAPIWNFLGMVVSAVMDTLVKVIGWFVGIVVESLLKPFLTWLIDTFTAVFNTVVGVVNAAFQVIKGIFEVALSIIRGISEFFTNVLKGNWEGAFNAIKNMVGGVMNGIRNIIEGILKAVASIVGGALDRLFATFKAVFTGISNFIGGLWNTFVQHGKNLVEGVINGIGAMITNIMNAAKNIGHAILNGIGNVLGGLGSAPAKIVEIGVNIAKGLWEGIKSMIGWVADQVAGFIKNVIPGPIKDFLGIASPSKLTMELGRYVALGLAMGITQTEAPVIKSVDHLTGAVIARAEAGSREMNTALADAGLSASANFSFSSANERTLTLRVEVVSPDGSVDRLTADQLAGLLKGSDVVTAIEHAASLD